MRCRKPESRIAKLSREEERQYQGSSERQRRAPPPPLGVFFLRKRSDAVNEVRVRAGGERTPRGREQPDEDEVEEGDERASPPRIFHRHEKQSRNAGERPKKGRCDVDYIRVHLVAVSPSRPVERTIRVSQDR